MGFKRDETEHTVAGIQYRLIFTGGPWDKFNCQYDNADTTWRIYQEMYPLSDDIRIQTVVRQECTANELLAACSVETKGRTKSAIEIT